MANGEFARARPLLEEALQTRARVLGDHHPEVARSLLFLANLEVEQGRESIAIPLVERAAVIQKSALAENDPERVRAVNMLAGLRYNAGDYTTPAALWEEVLATRRANLGADHPLVAETLHNLGALATETGDYDQGLIYLEQAFQIRRDRLGKNHPYVASTLVVMAAALRSLGDLAGARARYGEALRIRERARNEAELAWTLRWTGELLLQEGNFSRAKSLLTQARSIQERSLGAEHEDLAGTLAALAAVAEHEGRRDEAQRLFERSVAIRQAAYGSTYPDAVATLGRYARFLASIGDSSRAFDVALPAALARVEHLRFTTRGLAERQALAYAQVGSQSLDVLLALAAANPAPDRVRAAGDVLIRARTIVLDEIAARHRAMLAEARDSSMAAPRRDLDAARRRFANLLVRGVGVDDPEHYRQAIDRAREEVESAERALATRSGRSPGALRQEDVGWSQVLEALPEGWGLLAFARHGSGNDEAYVALVAGRSRSPVAAPLGSASTLEPLVVRYAGLLARADRNFRGEYDPAVEQARRKAGTALRRRLWDPLAPLVGGFERIFVVPDGPLHLLNFAALPAGADSYLVETGPLLHYLTAERDLVRITRRHGGVGLLALGGASFDAGEEPPVLPAARRPAEDLDSAKCCPESRTRSAGEGRPQPDCRDFRDTRFLPLPESAREVEEISSLWGDPATITALTGTHAGEAALKALAPGRRVLHLATPGFFLDAARCASERAGARGIGGVSGPTPARKRAVARRRSPLLLSGLALAGANLRLKAKPDQEDGILMAQEIVSLDLSSAEWVVLSACDTGVGKLQAGEGVLGLRRAFEVAGAGTAIMSLWGVEDRSTREWMRRLYDARFHRRRSTPEAVRDAALGVLQDRRAHGRSTHPFYWAGFVAAGDWR